MISESYMEGIYKFLKLAIYILFVFVGNKTHCVLLSDLLGIKPNKNFCSLLNQVEFLLGVLEIFLQLWFYQDRPYFVIILPSNYLFSWILYFVDSLVLMVLPCPT